MASILILVIFIYSAFNSIPMKFLPSVLAIIAVVPLPIKGSKIKPFSGQANLIGTSKRACGKLAKWSTSRPSSFSNRSHPD